MIKIIFFSFVKFSVSRAETENHMKKLLQMATRQAIKQLFYLIGLRLSDLLRFIFFTSRSSHTNLKRVAVNNFDSIMMALQAV